MFKISDKICIAFIITDSSHRNVWNIKVDPDILDTIKDTFPNWFAPTNTNLITTSSIVASTSKFPGIQAPFSIKIESPFDDYLELETMANGNINIYCKFDEILTFLIFIYIFYRKFRSTFIKNYE